MRLSLLLIFAIIVINFIPLVGTIDYSYYDNLEPVLINSEYKSEPKIENISTVEKKGYDVSISLTRSTLTKIKGGFGLKEKTDYAFDLTIKNDGFREINKSAWILILIKDQEGITRGELLVPFSTEIGYDLEYPLLINLKPQKTQRLTKGDTITFQLSYSIPSEASFGTWTAYAYLYPANIPSYKKTNMDINYYKDEPIAKNKSTFDVVSPKSYYSYIILILLWPLGAVALLFFGNNQGFRLLGLGVLISWFFYFFQLLI